MLIFQLDCRSKAQNVGNQMDYVDVGLNFWALIQYKLIKMSSYQYRKSLCGDKVVRSSYLHIVISFTGKMSSLYWIRALVKKARMDLKRGDRIFPWCILKKKKTILLLHEIRVDPFTYKRNGLLNCWIAAERTKFTFILTHSISQPSVHPCFTRAIKLIAHPKITLILSFSWRFSSKVAFCTP